MNNHAAIPGASPVTLKRARARAFAERAAQRAAHLPEAERLLVLAICQQGQSATHLAALMGKPSRTIRRRIRNLLRRVMTPEFALVVASRQDWAPTMRDVATACIINGRSLTAAARDLSLSYHIVRRHRDAIVAMARAQSSRTARTLPAQHKAAA
ncbi:MAG: hypothetical protein ACKVS8_01895 [Phycisphaerales bacterium]